MKDEKEKEITRSTLWLLIAVLLVVTSAIPFLLILPILGIIGILGWRFYQAYKGKEEKVEKLLPGLAALGILILSMIFPQLLWMAAGLALGQVVKIKLEF